MKSDHLLTCSGQIVIECKNCGDRLFLLGLEEDWDSEHTSFGTFFQGCGGTLVDSIHYLTAAHCVVDDTTGAVSASQDLLVVLGEVNLNDVQAEEVYGVNAVEPNASYNRFTVQNDVAMLTLNRPANLKPTRVVKSNETFLWAPGVTARIIGWGTTCSQGCSSSPVLLEADVSMVSDQDCAADYAGRVPAFDPQTMVCAGDQVGDPAPNDTCAGDSGGPLLVPDGGPGKFALAGIVSWG